MTTVKVAVIQTNSINNKAENLARIQLQVEDAIANGAKLIQLPEVCNYRGCSEDMRRHAESLDGDTVTVFRTLCQQHNVSVILGSICEKEPDAGESLEGKAHKAYNTSIHINNNGEIGAIYRKIHLFDAVVKGTPITESNTFLSGNKPQLCQVDALTIGLSICYDLRFPELYRLYSMNGATVLSIPASFTKPTGEAHWKTLLQARAIENTCYVLAANQCGIGASNVPSYGHSMIIDPWGKILAEAEEEETILYATIDLNKLKKYRAALPSLTHARLLLS